MFIGSGVISRDPFAGGYYYGEVCILCKFPRRDHYGNDDHICPSMPPYRNMYKTDVTMEVIECTFIKHYYGKSRQKWMYL